jgi:hypothetical protein
MNKIVLIFSLISLISSAGMAQTNNVDVDNFNFTCTYRALPEQPQSPVRFLYSTNVVLSGIAKNYLVLDDFADAITIEGQIKAAKPDTAQFVVEMTVGNVGLKSSEVQERQVKSKDKTGKAIITIYYKVLVKYTFDADYKIKSAGKVIKEGSCFSSPNFSFTTKEFEIKKDATDYWEKNKDTEVANFYLDRSKQAADNLSALVSVQYGFTVAKKTDHLKITDTKKHNENISFRAATDALKTELQSMTENVPMNRDVIDPLIEYFKSLPQKYSDPKSKADGWIRYAAWWNLCKIYLYLDEPENVAQYANLIFPNGYDPKDGAKLNKEATDLKTVFDKTGIHTRHFDPAEYFAK